MLQVVHPPGPLSAPYITLPLELWSRGWINVLSARALFAYVCLRLLFVSKPEGTSLHVSVWERQRFAMSDDTWQQASQDLEGLGLVSSSIEKVAADSWSHDRRRRKVVRLNEHYLIENNSPTSWGAGASP